MTFSKSRERTHYVSIDKMPVRIVCYLLYAELGSSELLK